MAKMDDKKSELTTTMSNLKKENVDLNTKSSDGELSLTETELELKTLIKT